MSEGQRRPLEADDDDEALVPAKRPRLTEDGAAAGAGAVEAPAAAAEAPNGTGAAGSLGGARLKRKRKRRGGDSDSDDFAPAVSRFLADSDAESSSSEESSSSSEEEEAPKPKAAAGADAPEAPQAPEAKKPAPASPSSESSSSSSSSESDSESEAEGPAAVGFGARSEAPEEELQVAKVDQFGAVRRAILKRDELAKLLSSLPSDAAEEAVVRAFVRLAVQAARSEQDSGACVLAEIVGLEPSPAYVVTRSDGQRTTLKIRLRCKRGPSFRLVKVSSVSNRDLTEVEHEQWKKMMERTGVEPEVFTDMMVRKADDIEKARNFKFDDATVAKMLAKKGMVEFDAQKESRMRFLVQCAMSQMDISGIRDHDARELEQRYKDSLDQLRSQEAKSTDVQAQWFDKRANLFSLKMINKKNYERQVRDDRHALDYTLANESAGKEGLNPFQRRACRPLVAWDTKLTAVDGLPGGAGEEAAEDAAKAAPAAAAASSEKEASKGEEPLNDAQRMQRYLKAHHSARALLADFTGLGR